MLGGLSRYESTCTVSIKHIDGLSFVDNELQSVGQSIGVENTLGEAHGPIGSRKCGVGLCLGKRSFVGKADPTLLRCAASPFKTQCPLFNVVAQSWCTRYGDALTTVAVLSWGGQHNVGGREGS